MFKFRKQKPFVLSQTNSVPLNAVQKVIRAFHKLCLAPIFSLGEPELKDLSIEISPFSMVVDTEGGKVYLCQISGHYEAWSLGNRAAYPFSADILVRLFENGKAPCIAYEGWHEITLESTTFRLIFKTADDFKFTVIRGDDVAGSWIFSEDIKRLDELGLPVRLENYLYALRIRTLGHLKQWKRSQIVADMDDVSLRAALDISLEKLGVKLKAED